jgi:hypothetical protein
MTPGLNRETQHAAKRAKILRLRKCQHILTFISSHSLYFSPSALLSPLPSTSPTALLSLCHSHPLPFYPSVILTLCPFIPLLFSPSALLSLCHLTICPFIPQSISQSALLSLCQLLACPCSSPNYPCSLPDLTPSTNYPCYLPVRTRAQITLTAYLSLLKP